MAWQVAIPSYRRAPLLKEQTLALLRRHSVPRERITVFVADEEQRAEYAAVLDPESYGVLRVGAVGLAAVRNFMTRYYPPGTQLLYMDDDVKDAVGLCAGAPRGVRPLANLQEFVTSAFAEAERTGFRLWGVYPIENGYFMRDHATTDLRYIVGCFYGLVNPGPALEITQPFKEDFERSIKMYLLDGGVLRFNHVAPVTRYWTTPGGLQAFRTRDAAADSASFLAGVFHDLTRLRDKKSGTDLCLRDRRAVRTFGVEALRAYQSPIEKLLLALQLMRWTRRQRLNVYPTSCYTQLAWAKNRHADVFALALATAPRRDFEFAQLNKSVQMKRHVDKYNASESMLLLLGDFEGGALCFDDGRRFAEKGVWIPFDGRVPHWVEPFTGERFSIILFNNRALRANLERLNDYEGFALNPEVGIRHRYERVRKMVPDDAVEAPVGPDGAGVAAEGSDELGVRVEPGPDAKRRRRGRRAIAGVGANEALDLRGQAEAVLA